MSDFLRDSSPFETSHPKRQKLSSTSVGAYNNLHLLDYPSVIKRPDAVLSYSSAMARRFLKENGKTAFVNKYVMACVDIEAVCRIIEQLGFASPKYTDQSLAFFYKQFDRIVEEVLRWRPSLEMFSTREDVVYSVTHCERVLVIIGGGIYTSSFNRAPLSIKSDFVTNTRLTSPRDVLGIEQFMLDPALFYSMAHQLQPKCTPLNVVHKFARLLLKKGSLLSIYSQNLDDGETRAGITPEKILHTNGLFATATCVTCGHHPSNRAVLMGILKARIPYCGLCIKSSEGVTGDNSARSKSYGVLRPDIRFYGEDLPDTFLRRLEQDSKDCDLIISIGASLQEPPVWDLLKKVSQKVPRVLIGEYPHGNDNFDVCFDGPCHEVVSYLCSHIA